MSHLFNNQVVSTRNVDDASHDAFNRLRTSDSYTLFSDRGMIDNGMFWSTDVGGAGSIDTANSSNSSEILLKVGTASGDYAYRQSRQRTVYQPGKSQLLMISFKFNPKENVRQRVGYFDTEDGIYLEHDGVNASLVIRTNSSGTVDDSTRRIAQSTWSYDKFDGTGPSGKTVDWTKTQILVVDLEWLGVGRVRAGLVLDGQICYGHMFSHSNVETATYMGHATLPIRMEIQNIGVSASATELKSICCSVSSESGQQNQGLPFSVDNGTTSISVGVGTWSHMLTIRLRPEHTNAAIELLAADLLNTSNDFCQYRILWNATLTNPSWTNTGQLVQYDTSATVDPNSGSQIATGYIAQKATPTVNDFQSRLRGGFAIDGTPDTFTIVVYAVGGNVTARAAMTWKELY